MVPQQSSINRLWLELVFFFFFFFLCCFFSFFQWLSQTSEPACVLVRVRPAFFALICGFLCVLCAFVEYLQVLICNVCVWFRARPKFKKQKQHKNQTKHSEHRFSSPSGHSSSTTLFTHSSTYMRHVWLPNTGINSPRNASFSFVFFFFPPFNSFFFFRPFFFSDWSSLLLFLHTSTAHTHTHTQTHHDHSVQNLASPVSRLDSHSSTLSSAIPSQQPSRQTPPLSAKLPSSPSANTSAIRPSTAPFSSTNCSTRICWAYSKSTSPTKSFWQCARTRNCRVQILDPVSGESVRVICGNGQGSAANQLKHASGCDCRPPISSFRCWLLQPPCAGVWRRQWRATPHSWRNRCRWQRWKTLLLSRWSRRRRSWQSSCLRRQKQACVRVRRLAGFCAVFRPRCAEIPAASLFQQSQPSACQRLVHSTKCWSSTKTAQCSTASAPKTRVALILRISTGLCQIAIDQQDRLFVADYYKPPCSSVWCRLQIHHHHWQWDRHERRRQVWWTLCQWQWTRATPNCLWAMSTGRIQVFSMQPDSNEFVFLRSFGREQNSEPGNFYEPRCTMFSLNVSLMFFFCFAFVSLFSIN